MKAFRVRSGLLDPSMEFTESFPERTIHVSLSRVMSSLFV